MSIVWDNQDALHIAFNLVLLEQTKHIEIDRHFICEKIMYGEIGISFVGFIDQSTHIFTMSLRGPMITYTCDKLDASYLYIAVRQGVLRYA